MLHGHVKYHLIFKNEAFPWFKEYLLPTSSYQRIENWKNYFTKQAKYLDIQEHKQKTKEKTLDTSSKVIHRINQELQSPTQRVPDLIFPCTPAKLSIEHIHAMGTHYFAKNFTHQSRHTRFHFAYLLEKMESPLIELPEVKNKKLTSLEIPSQAQLLWEQLIGFYISLPTPEGDLAQNIVAMFEIAFARIIPDSKIVRDKAIEIEGCAILTTEEIALQFKSLLAQHVQHRNVPQAHQHVTHPIKIAEDFEEKQQPSKQTYKIVKPASRNRYSFSDFSNTTNLIEEKNQVKTIPSSLQNK